MPNPLAHAPAMLTVIRPSTLPRFWWVNPWSTVSYLHEAVTALKGYADRLDSCINLQHTIIDDQSAEVAGLRHRIAELTIEVTAAQQSREHWIAKHAQAYAVAMHNEKVIARLEDSITAGAITPDPQPHE